MLYFFRRWFAAGGVVAVDAVDAVNVVGDVGAVVSVAGFFDVGVVTGVGAISLVLMVMADGTRGLRLSGWVGLWQENWRSS